MGKVAKGHDPMAEKRTAVAATGNTLQSVCENYFAPDAKKLRSVSDRQRTLHRLVYPKLGARQIEEIQRKDIVRLLDKIDAVRAVHAADRHAPRGSRQHAAQRSRPRATRPSTIMRCH